jgi:hypothetical protein
MEQAHIWQTAEADIQRLEKDAVGPRLPEDCRYYKPGVGFDCKTRDVGLDSYVECLEKGSFSCPFSVQYAYTYYCSCRVRVIMAKKFEV